MLKNIFTRTGARPEAPAAELPGLDAGGGVRAWVDGLDEGRVVGWAFKPESPHERLHVELWAGGRPVVAGWASKPRPDLIHALGGHGEYGFALPVDNLGLPDHEIDNPPDIEVRAGGVRLPQGEPMRLASAGEYDDLRYGVFRFEPRDRRGGLFFQPEDIGELKGRRTLRPFQQIAAAARARARSAMKAGPGPVLERKMIWRGFTWRNVLQDVMLTAVLDEDDELLAFVDGLIGELAGQPEAPGAYLPDEVNIGFVTVGLMMALDLAEAARAPLSSREAAYGLLTRFSDYLWGGWREAHRGHPARNRLAWNHTSIGYAVTGLCALAGQVSTPEAEERLAISTAKMQGFLRYGLDEAGMTREGISYCGFTFGIVGAFLKALMKAYPVRHYFHAAPGCQEGKLTRMVEWYAYDAVPMGGLLGAWNDSMAEPHQAFRGLLHLPDPALSPLVRSLWTELIGDRGDQTYGDWPKYIHSFLFDSYCFLPAQPSPPEHRQLPLTRFYPTDGYLYARTDWSKKAAALTFKCGPHTTGVHGQSDNNSFTFAAFGQPLIVDSGPSNRPDPEGASQWRAHSIVSVNGEGQRLSSGGLGVYGRFLEREEGADYVYAAGDATASYEPAVVSRAVRHMLFVKEPFPFLVGYDDVASVGELERLDWRFHLDLRYRRLRPGAPGQWIAGTEDYSGHGALFVFAEPPGEHSRAVFEHNRPHFVDVFSSVGSPRSLPFVVLPFDGETPEVRISAHETSDAVGCELHIGASAFELRFPRGEALGYLGRGRLRPRSPIVRRAPAT